LTAAALSEPDAIGLISWNEFSENTHIEPSITHGSHYKDLVARLRWVESDEQADTEPPVGPATLEIQTVPALAGVTFAVEGQSMETDVAGFASVEIARPGRYDLELVEIPETPERRVRFQRWRIDHQLEPRLRVVTPSMEPIEVAFEISHPIRFRFLDAGGRRVDAARVEALTLRGNDGRRLVLDPEDTVWLPANRIVKRLTGLAELEAEYTLESVQVDGTEVAQRGRQRFTPSAEDSVWTIDLLLFDLGLTSRDLLLGNQQGRGVVLELPDGSSRRLTFDSSGEVAVPSLARGLYRVSTEGALGIPLEVPVQVSRNQQIELKVISWVDLLCLLAVALTLGVGLLVAGRPWLLTSWR
jgi:hypothetical protein